MTVNHIIPPFIPSGSTQESLLYLLDRVSSNPILGVSDTTAVSACKSLVLFIYHIGHNRDVDKNISAVLMLIHFYFNGIHSCNSFLFLLQIPMLRLYKPRLRRSRDIIESDPTSARTKQDQLE
jgi:hypothetical protein